MNTREKKRGGCSIENSVSYSIPFTVTFTFREYLPYKPIHLKEIGRFRSGIRETSVFGRIWKKERLLWNGYQRNQCRAFCIAASRYVYENYSQVLREQVFLVEREVIDSPVIYFGIKGASSFWSWAKLEFRTPRSNGEATLRFVCVDGAS